MNKITFEIRQWCGLFAIPKNHRLPLLLAFLTGVLAYAIFIFHHLLDGHGLPTMPWVDASYWGPKFGRWTSSAIVALGYNADIPVLNALIGVVLLLLSGYYAFQTFADNQSGNLERYIVISLVVAFPINLSFFYYTYSTMPFAASIFFAVIAARSCSLGTWIGGILGFVILLLMWTTYQASIGVFLVLIAAFWISTFLRSAREVSPYSAVLPQAMLRSLFVAGIVLISSSAIYAIIFKIFAYGPGHASPIRFSQILELWTAAAISAFQHLWFSQPDLHKLVKIITVGVVCVAFLGSMWICRKKWICIVFLLLLWPSCLMATKAIFFITKINVPNFEYRLNAGLGFFYAFAFWVLFYLFRKINWAYKICIILACFTLLRFVQADLVRQIVNKRGETHDLAFANRILSRIEALEGLDPSKKYQIVRIGNFPFYNWNLLTSGGRKYEKSGDCHMDFDPVTAKWVPHLVFKYLGARVELIHDDFAQGQRRTKFAEKYLLQNKKPYPADGSVFVLGDTIFIYLEKISHIERMQVFPKTIKSSGDFKRISENSWQLSMPDVTPKASSAPCWYALSTAKATKNKDYAGLLSIESDKDLQIRALLCSHDAPFEGTNKTFNLKANKPQDIYLLHRFKENSPAVKLQLNVDNGPDGPANLKIQNIFIGEYP